MPAGALLVTADPALTAAVPRLCALAGVGLEIERDSGAARASWRSAATILVGSDVAAALAAAGVPRRDRVIVVTSGVADIGCWQASLALGANAVLRLPDQEAALIDELRDGSAAAGPSAQVVGVVGGCGGAGASTLAAALALTAAPAGKVLLLDGDPLGGGLDVLVGAESVPGVRWNDLASTRGRLDAEALASAVCETDGIRLLSWGRPHLASAIDDAVVEAVVVAARSAFAMVVIDIGRSPSHMTSGLLDASDALVVVVPADVRAVAATASFATVLGRRLGAPHLVVRDPGGGRLSAKDVAASLGFALAATLRSEPSVAAAAQRGEAPARRGRCALRQVCEELLAVIGTAAT